MYCKTLATESEEGKKHRFFGTRRKVSPSIAEDCTAAVPAMKSNGAAPFCRECEQDPTNLLCLFSLRITKI
jgi:hypothetical protein